MTGGRILFPNKNQHSSLNNRQFFPTFSPLVAIPCSVQKSGVPLIF
jgi:hypothetical protein